MNFPANVCSRIQHLEETGFYDKLSRFDANDKKKRMRVQSSKSKRKPGNKVSSENSKKRKLENPSSQSKRLPKKRKAE